MPVSTRSMTNPMPAPAPVVHKYHLRNARPSSGFYTELNAEDMAAAETLVSMRSSMPPASVSAVATRRSSRLASRS